MNKEKIILALFVLLTLGACAQKKDAYRSPDGYDLSRPVRYPMPEVLKEISGIDFHEGNPDTLYAEQDEEGRVFMVRPGEKKVTHVKFAGKGDYEDIALVGGYVVMLRSDGVLYDFPFPELRAGEIKNTRKWEDLLPRGEYESLYGDPRTGTLFLLTKDSREDSRTHAVSGYELNLAGDGEITLKRGFSFRTDKLESYPGMHHKDFRCSALAKDTRTGQWYILASVNKMLVVTDSLFRVREVCPLDPSLFPQPEGIAFDRDGALYISNEGDKTTPGTVLKFAWQGAGRSAHK
jgi:hypothetical protein